MTDKTYIDDRRTYSSSYYPNTTFGYYFHRIQSGPNSPDFPFVLRDNEYSLNQREYDSESFTMTFKRPGYNPISEGWYRTRYGVPTPSLTWSSNDTIKLTNKLAAKVRDHNMNMGNFLIESDQTVRMIGNTIYRITAGIHYARKGLLKDAANILIGGHKNKLTPQSEWERKTWFARLDVIEQEQKYSRRRKRKLKIAALTASNAWLELQYGWKPLLSDIHEAVDAYEAIVNKPVVFTFRTARKITAETIHKGDASRPIVGWARKTIRKSYIIRVSQQESVLSSLSLDNPLGALWEFTKFSFLVDWFVPIGQFLDASHAAKSLKVERCISSTLTRITAGTTALWDGYRPGYARLTPFLPKDRDSSVFMTREVLTSLPKVPPPRAKDYASVASLAHVSNAIALLTQVALSPSHKPNDGNVGRVVRFKMYDL